MECINYLKLDLRIIKGKIKISLILPICIGMMVIFINNTVIMGIGYLLFVLIGLATMPFDSAISENGSKMYVIFPAKVSSMVLGRFIYLSIVSLLIFSIDGVIVEYLHTIKAISINQILGILLAGILTLGVCFFQYPIYYRFGFENRKIISMLLYIVPGVSVFALTSFISSNVNACASTVLNFILNNKSILVIMVFIICIIIGITSYLISCNICARKEL